MNDVNRQRLIDAALLLQPLLDDLVFVGGAVTGLLITGTAAAGPRATIDLDAIAEITSYAECAQFGDRLRALGFTEDTTEDAPVRRWVRQSVVLDVMPLDEDILGFSNRYRAALTAAETHLMAADLSVRIVSTLYSVATKLIVSKDLEDIVSVLDGRPS